jgi:hypothetical protein
VDSCEHGNKPSCYIKILGSSWVAVQLAASQGELSSMNLVYHS